MASNPHLLTPNMSKKLSSSSALGGGGGEVLSRAPSLLSLRSVIDFMPHDIRRRYKDTAKYLVWMECPLDEHGNAVDIEKHSERNKFGGSISGLSARLKRNFTLTSGDAATITTREYSKFGNAPIVVDTASLKKPPLRTPVSAVKGNVSPLRQRREKETAAKPSVVYYSSKGGEDVDIKLSSADMTRL